MPSYLAAKDTRPSELTTAVQEAWSADFVIVPAEQESRTGVDIASLLVWGTHRTVYSSEKRWSAMVQLLATFPDQPSPRAGTETRFGIIFLSRTKPVGSLFCRNPYAIAASEVAVDCLVEGKVKMIPVSTLRALVGLAFTPEEH